MNVPDMKWNPCKQYKHFTAYGRAEDARRAVVLIDDYFLRVVIGHKEEADERWLQAAIDGLLASLYVRKVIVCGFDFDFKWLSSNADLTETLFIVDLYSGIQPNISLRGQDAIARLRSEPSPVQVEQIALFTKASDEDLARTFGKDHGFEVIPKAGIDARGDVAGSEKELKVHSVDRVLSFVASRCHDPYLDAVSRWAKLKRDLLKFWDGEVRLFPTGDEHNASWWLNSATPERRRQVVERGLVSFREVLSDSDLALSDAAILYGLKGVLNGCSARLLCEVAGMEPSALSEVESLKLRRPFTRDAQLLFAVRKFFSDNSSSAEGWRLRIDHLDENELVLAGVAGQSSARRAEDSAKELNMTPTEKLCCESAGTRSESPGEGWVACRKIRLRGCEMVFTHVGHLLTLRLVCPLQGRLT